VKIGVKLPKILMDVFGKVHDKGTRSMHLSSFISKLGKTAEISRYTKMSLMKAWALKKDSPSSTSC